MKKGTAGVLIQRSQSLLSRFVMRRDQRSKKSP